MTTTSSWRDKALPSISLVLASVLLTMLAAFFAAVPLRALRRISGRTAYWTWSLAAVAVFFILKSYAIALILSSLVVLIGSFSEYEKSGDSLVNASACAILTTFAGWALGFMGAWWYFGRDLMLMLSEKANNFVVLVTEIYLKYNSGVELSAADIKGVLFAQAPAILLMGLMVSLFLAVLFEKKVVHLFQVQIKAPTYKLTYFRVHDVVIWLFIFSLLGSFTNYQNEMLKMVSLNTFYISLLLLFFQGLAVMAHFFNTTSMGTGWRVFWYYIMTVHFTLFLAILGLMDYWLNFRLRVARRAAELRKSQKL